MLACRTNHSHIISLATRRVEIRIYVINGPHRMRKYRVYKTKERITKGFRNVTIENTQIYKRKIAGVKGMKQLTVLKEKKHTSMGK